MKKGDLILITSHRMISKEKMSEIPARYRYGRITSVHKRYSATTGKRMDDLVIASMHTEKRKTERHLEKGHYKILEII